MTTTTPPRPGERHLARMARGAEGIKPSEIPTLFAVRGRTDVVSLAGGMPNLEGLPQRAIADETAGLVALGGKVVLQYGSAQGLPKLREQICEVMSLEGIAADPDDVVVTVGSQMALDFVTRIFCDPGDLVLTEAPSYIGALGVFASYRADVVQVPVDDRGLVPDALRVALEDAERAGRRPKFLYTVPNFHNPAGVTLAVERRAEVLEICAAHDVLVVEDNPYGMLALDGRTFPALRSMDAENVVYLGSFSKTIAPGLRIGWVTAPAAVREKLVQAAESTTLCPPAFTQAVLSRYLARHDWRAQIDTYRDSYRVRRDAMLAALAEHLPEGSRWTRPEGGFFVWVTVPDGVDTDALMPYADRHKVAYVPGSAFYAEGSGRGRSELRLSFSYPTPERIAEGVRRLGLAITDYQSAH
ncbi:PLP-dependent aminotransferase family protein [Streptomyces mobaraensis NBRC 13819 = DSM 40847]|uniref:Valine-pyruvate aminotransferase n=1 Tax=Streptomyces mobaraensis (strain ATCC 29032 / DSM 40847 / JCM 4168 / NBRC 13819 / NCIMB 11159 / IPCR 16-22) TaxID=1223523 RepID=M3BQL3_STRM1|nr:PLP-dependent aminotransferase family protein [Streptomyces mobaraensis]EMF02000.1 valine-pyruvate aminotransferase [Streptomyces mobaraensis NBRC 13819 = DSM 40847]QTT76369.1 PLP-dependent aminotransferase family protein [Streptomyces mobaraensis NBRC 13819 = DSM 40847]